MKTSHSPSKGVSGLLVAVILIGAVVGVVFLFPGIFRGFGGGVAGLVGPGSAGVVIKSFTVDTPTTETNVPVSFTLTMENVGEREATNVKAELFGLSNEWKDKNEKTVPLNFGKFDGESKDKLAGTDPANRIPGDVELEDLILTNKVSKDTDTPYSASVRVSYAYDTIVEGLVRVVNRDYARTQGATMTQTSINAKVTSGPLSVIARPRITTGVTEDTRTVTLFLELTNAGGGRTFKGDKIEFVNVDWVSFDTTKSGTTIKCADATTGEFRLINSKKTLKCDLTLPTGVTTFQDFAFRVGLTYKYFVTASTSLTLLKTLGATTIAPSTGGTTSLSVSYKAGSLSASPTTAKIGDKVTLSVTYKNSGSAALSGTPIRFTATRGPTEKTACDPDPTIDIAANQEKTFSCSWNTAGLSAGEWTINAVTLVLDDNPKDTEIPVGDRKIVTLQ